MIQLLLTMAREQLDFTVLIFNNRAYSFLNTEFARTGTDAGPRDSQSSARIGQSRRRFRRARNSAGRPVALRVDPGNSSPVLSTSHGSALAASDRGRHPAVYADHF